MSENGSVFASTNQAGHFVDVDIAAAFRKQLFNEFDLGFFFVGVCLEMYVMFFSKRGESLHELH